MNKISLVLCGISFGAAAYAQTWQPAGGGTWNNTGNWDTAVIPDSDSAQVLFSKDFTNSPALPTITLDRATPFTVNKISYNDTAATYYSCTISAGSPAGSLIFAGTTPTVDTPAASANAADLVISAPADVSAAGLTKTGARNVYLNGAVTGFGPSVYTNVSAGMLAIGPATTIDWTTVNKAYGSGTLRLDALTTMNIPAVFAVGAGELQLNPSSGTFALNAAGLTKTGGGTLRLNRPLGGSGPVVLAGSLNLTVDNTGAGLASAFTVQLGGRLYANHLKALVGATSVTVQSGGALRADQAGTYSTVPTTLSGSGASGDDPASALFFRSGGNTTVVWPGAITLGSGGAAIGSYGVTYLTTLSGGIGGSGPLTIHAKGGSSSSHSATFTLSSPCSYTGSTTVRNNDGILHITLKSGVANALPTGTVLTLSDTGGGGKNAYFDLSGFNQTLAGLLTGGTAANKTVTNSSATAATLTLAHTGANSYGGKLGGKLSLVKASDGILTLSSANSYSGGTIVSNGTLLVSNASGSGTGTGAVTAESGVTLGGTGTVQGGVTLREGAALTGTLTVQGDVSASAGASVSPGDVGTVGTLTLQKSLALNAASLAFDLPSSGAGDAVALTGVLTNSGVTTLTINLLNGSLPAGSYTLISYASLVNNGSFALDFSNPSATLTESPSGLVLTVTGGGLGKNLTWVGNGSSNPWDIATSAVWNNGVDPDVFLTLDNVTFNDSGSASPAVNIAAAVRPSFIVVSNVLSAYTFAGSGSLAGPCTLVKQGTNTLTLALANTNSGLTTVSAGRLVYGVDNALGSGPVTVSGSGATLALGAFSDTVGTVTLDGGAQITGTSGSLSSLGTFELKSGTVSAVLAGSGAVNKTTPATVTLSGSNTYSGVTTIGVFGASNSVLAVAHNNALGSTASGTTVNGGSLYVENTVHLNTGIKVTDETLTLDSGASYRAKLRYSSSSGMGTWDGNIVLAGSSGTYLDSGTAGGTLVVGGSIEDTITGSAANLFLRGAGLVTVNSRISIGSTSLGRDDAGTATLTSTGNVWNATNISQGTLRLGVSDALPSTTVLTIGKGGASAAAAFDLNGKSQLVSGLADLHNTTGTQKILSATPATLIVSNSAANTFGLAGSSVEGEVTLVKAGSGTLTLTGTNSTAGALIVSNGTMAVSATGTLGGNCTNVVVAGGTLALSNSACLADSASLVIENGGSKVSLASGVNETVKHLFFSALQKAAGTYGASGSGARFVDDARFSGDGVLTVLLGTQGTMMQLR